ncbi:Probable fructokinase-5 [Linum perenne]
MAMIVAFGEMLIDFVPDVAGVSLAESNGFLKAPGGAPANVACAITKLGGKSAFLGKIGDDEFGHMLVEILKKNNVNTEGVCFDKDARTALAFVTLKHNGEREFMFYRNPSADMLLKESELNMNLIKQAKNEADFIKVSDDEVEFLTKGSADKEEVVMSLWHDKLKLLVVTDGPKGCRYFTKNFKGSVGGYSVKAVDTTGAGDAFVGSFLVSVAKDPSIFENEEKLKEALAFSNACGAICTTQKGAIPALPTSNDALALMKTK